MFCIMNNTPLLPKVGHDILEEEEIAFKFLSKGIKCKLYRNDGSCKPAIIDLTDQYLLRAYKYPDGEIKRKYTLSIRQIKDWQFSFKTEKEAWKNSVFIKGKAGIF